MSAINPSLTTPNLRRLPFTVRLAPQFLNRLLSRRQQLTTAPDSIHGLLFGIADENLVVVQAFRSLTGIEEESTHEGEVFNSLLASVRKDPEISPLELVGWYAGRANGGLLQSDVQFHNLHFQRPNDLALVLKQEGSTTVLMELYCRSAEGVLSSEGHRWGAVRQSVGSTFVGPVEVSMRSKIQDDWFLRIYQENGPGEDNGDPGRKDAFRSTTKKALEWLTVGRNDKELKSGKVSQSLAQNPEASRASQGVAKGSKPLPPPAAVRQPSATSLVSQRDSKTASLQSIHAGAPPGVPAVVPPTPRRRSLPWISSALVFAVAAGLTFGLVYNRGLFGGDSTPGFLRSLFPAPTLGLRLETQGDRLLLSWNRHHPIVRNTRGGILQIDDGAQHRQVILDASQISNGSVLYRPNSDDVTFRLEVDGLRNEKVSESMRVLDTPKPGNTLDLSTPAVAASAKERPVASQQQSGDGVAERKAVRQALSAPARTSMTVARRQAKGMEATSPVASSPVTASPSMPAGSTPSVPTPPISFDVPVKRAEPQEQAHFDVLPTTQPAQAGKSEPITPANSSPAPSPTTTPAETARNTPPKEILAAPAPAVEKPNPDRQKPLPAPNSAAPLNALDPKAVTPSRASTGYHAPHPLRQVLPNTSLLPSGVLAGAGRVEVILHVDETGHVTEAHLANGAKRVSPLTAGASIQAARQWVFAPATLNGKPVPSEHSVVFQFQTTK